MQRQRLAECRKILASTQQVVPFGSYNKGLTDTEGNALFKKVSEYMAFNIGTIADVEDSRLRSLIAHFLGYKELYAAIESPQAGNPISVITAYLKMAKVMMTYGAGNCGVASIALYFALKNNVFPVDYGFISEDHQILVIGRTNSKEKLSLKEVRSLPDNVFGICAYTGNVFQMNQLFQDENHLAYFHPERIKQKEPLKKGVGLCDHEFVFRSGFQIDDPRFVFEPSVNAIMREIAGIPSRTPEHAKAEEMFSRLKTRPLPKPRSSALFKKSDHDELVTKLTEAQLLRPRLAKIVSLAKEKKYTSALRTAANDKQDGLTAVNILSAFKDSLKINIDEQVGEDARAAIHHAILKENWDVVDVLIKNGANTSLIDKHELSVETSGYKVKRF
jgi:hypothetical protein